VVGFGPDVVEGEGRGRHPDRREHLLVHRRHVRGVEGVGGAAGGQRRHVAAGGDHLVAVLERFADRGEELEGGQGGDDRFRVQLVGVEDDLQVAAGDTGAGADEILHPDPRRQRGIGDGEAR
jgi:hypothetical protein